MRLAVTLSTRLGSDLGAWMRSQDAAVLAVLADTGPSGEPVLLVNGAPMEAARLRALSDGSARLEVIAAEQGSVRVCVFIAKAIKAGYPIDVTAGVGCVDYC